MDYLVPNGKLLITFDQNVGNAKIECRRFEIHQPGEMVPQIAFRRGRLVSDGQELEFFVRSGRRRNLRVVKNVSGAAVFRES